LGENLAGIREPIVHANTYRTLFDLFALFALFAIVHSP
jgi:hypothetical protein